MATDLLARAPSDLEDNATEKFRSGEPIDDLASLIDREHDSVVGRMDEQPDHLLELGCRLRIVGELKLALSDFIRPLEDQSPFFSGQFAIDSAEGRYLDELYKVFFQVRVRARRYRPFWRVKRRQIVMFCDRQIQEWMVSKDDLRRF